LTKNILFNLEIERRDNMAKTAKGKDWIPGAAMMVVIDSKGGVMGVVSETGPVIEAPVSNPGPDFQLPFTSISAHIVICYGKGCVTYTVGGRTWTVCTKKCEDKMGKRK
jgi:hypothetical protein